MGKKGRPVSKARSPAARAIVVVEGCLGGGLDGQELVAVDVLHEATQAVSEMLAAEARSRSV